jgi:hypothetical protein
MGAKEMKPEEEKRIVQEKYKAKMKLLALKLYEDELAENARIAQIAEKTVPPAYAERAFESAYGRVRREERKSTLTRVAKRSAVCVAALALVVFSASALFGVRVDALIQKAVALLFTETATYDEITTVAGDAGAILDAADRSDRLPAYILEGYELSSREVYASFTLTVFTNDRQNLIRIEETHGEGKAMLDNEGSGCGKTTVHGETAFWTENEGGISLYWPRGEGSVAVFSDAETLDTLIKIAESMEMHP